MHDLNRSIKLFTHDKILAIAFINRIPKFIKPNHVTLIRFLLIFPVFYFIYKTNYALSITLFLLAACTDMLDGSLARIRKQITLWGIRNDPIADKILILGSILILMYKNFPSVLVFLILSIELLTISGAVHFRKKPILISSMMPGKIKMLFQAVGIALFFIYLVSNITIFFIISYFILILSIIFSIVNIFYFVHRYQLKKTFPI